MCVAGLLLEIGRCLGEEAFRTVGVAFLTSASAEIIFLETLHKRSSPGEKPNNEENLDTYCHGSTTDVAAEKAIVDGETGTNTDNDHLLVGVIMQLLLKEERSA